MQSREVRLLLLASIAAAVVVLLVFGADAFAQEVDARIVRESTPIEQLRPWLVTMFAGGSFALSFYLFMNQAKKSELKELTKVSEEKVEKLEERVDRMSGALDTRHKENSEKLTHVGERLNAVETHLDHLPTKDAVQRLEVSTARMEGDVKMLTQGLKGLTASTTRIEDFLLNRTGK